MLAKIFSIKGDLSDSHIKEVSGKVKVPLFEPKKTTIKKNEKDIYKKEQEKVEAIKELNKYDKKDIDLNKLEPQDIEIDDDTNGYIDFIHTLANLRAKNYNIKECDNFKTKMIVGDIKHIIPSIVTTASTITGLASLQLYTLYKTKKINFMRDCYLNLGINSIIMSEPKSVIRKKDNENDPISLGPAKAIPPGWTVWDKIIIKKSMTCKELIDYIMEKYKVEVSIITAGSVTIIQTFMPSSKKRLPQKIEDIYNENAKDNAKLGENDKYLNLEISGDIGEATALMPLFRYNFKN